MAVPDGPTNEDLLNDFAGARGDYERAELRSDGSEEHLQDCENKVRRFMKVRAELKERLAPEWQPIDTAPKDGSQFLAALSNGWVEIISRDPAWKNFAWYRGGSQRLPVEDTHGGFVFDRSVILATHWMPIPKAPNEARVTVSGSMLLRVFEVSPAGGRR